MSYKENGYLKVDGATRPICGKFELSAALTKLAKEVSDQKDLSDFIGNEIKYNAFVIPVGLAQDLYFRDKLFNCYFVRDNDIVSMKDMYINDQYLELIKNGVDKKMKVCKESIYNRLGERTQEKDLYEEDIESEDADEDKIQFGDLDEDVNIEEDIEILSDDDEDGDPYSKYD
jgi:hypothetical protein